jgi:hypothetical protein
MLGNYFPLVRVAFVLRSKNLQRGNQIQTKGSLIYLIGACIEKYHSSPVLRNGIQTGFGQHRVE